MPVPVPKRGQILVSSVFAAILALMAASGNWAVSSNFGRVAIAMPDGSKVYAVRESWGPHAERLSFTRNSDTCAPANPATDYIIRNPGKTEVLYSVTPRGLTIFDYFYAPLVEEPITPWSDVNIKRTVEPKYEDVVDSPRKYGATLASVPLNQVCLINIFRRSNSLR
jgi:hypothetical protein